MTLRSLAMAAALATVPFTASAVTFDADNNIAPGDVVPISGSPYFFDATFTDSDVSDTFSFTFTNDNPSSQAVVLTAGTVLQQTLEFLGGVTARFVGGEEVSISEGDVTETFELSSVIAPNGETTLEILFGDPTAITTNGAGNIDFSVVGSTQVIPLPASVLMLVGALGGLAFIGRKRSA
jgi:hypothetical protein